MRVIPITESDCIEVLQSVSFGRLGCCLNDQPYVIPVAFAYDEGQIYVFSTAGQKIEWMRQNPKICLQADEIGNSMNWTSVIVNGKYLELREPQYAAERQTAIEKLSQYSEWWRTPLAQRREKTGDLGIETVFFRIEIESMSGLRAVPEPQ
jgi:uncharacterized protein